MAELAFISVDAWAYGDHGWTWNDAWRVGSVPTAVADLPDGRMLRALRVAGLVGPGCNLRSCRVERDDCYATIVMRRDDKPIYAIDLGGEL